MRDSIVAKDPKIGLAIRMPGRWPFAACRAVALLSLGFLVGRASPSSGLMPALESCRGWPAMVAVVAGAGGKGATGASAARVAGDAPGSTNQRASASDPIVGFGGTSSSIATGTSGSAGFALAATTGCGASTGVAGPVVSAVAAGPNESAVIERVMPIANSQPHDGLLHCRFPEANRIKNRPYPPSPGSTALNSFKINSGWLEADWWRWRVDLGASVLRLRPEHPAARGLVLS